MAAVDDSRTLGRARLSFASEADVEEFVSTLDRFERGELTPDEWRAFRLVRGTYGQRQTGDTQMLRVKIPQGILSSTQLEALADVAERYSRGFGHITTRQNVQFHFVKLHDVEAAMRELGDAGLTTREACGNSVRNITACPYAGVAADEPFDVTPYAEAMTRYLLRHPMSSTLPRKFKIAFEGCAQDHAVTAINDIGFRARVRQQDGLVERGFRVTVGGGTSTLATSGRELFDFLPAGRILEVAEAVIRVFHRYGDREHKLRNRMKFLIRALGWDRWREEFDHSLGDTLANGPVRLPFDPADPPVEEAPKWARANPPSIDGLATRARQTVVRGPGIVPELTPPGRTTDRGFLHWARTNVRTQKQDDYAVVSVTIPLGDLTAGQMRALAELAASMGDGTVRTTSEQNLVFRWIYRPDIPALYRRLAAIDLALPDAGTVADVVSCPGAESCRLAVTQSRGMARFLGDHLRTRPDLIAAAPDLTIKISGCPNGCGQHHIAGIGLQGSVRKLAGKAAPQYFVMIGGAVDDSGATFGRLAAKVPARRMREALDRLIGLYLTDRNPGESATAFFGRVGLLEVRAVLADLAAMPAAEAEPDDFVDLGEESEFKPEVMEGECSA